MADSRLQADSAPPPVPLQVYRTACLYDRLWFPVPARACGSVRGAPAGVPAGEGCRAVAASVLLSLEAEAIAAITTFVAPPLFAAFGFPAILQVQGYSTAETPGP